MQENNGISLKRNLVSVIIPCYNAELYIREAIDSVLCQNYQDFEIIVVVDGATDQSEFIVREYAAKDKRIKCFVQSNKGVSITRNEGIAKAEGEFIAFLDADDAWGKENLEKKIALLDAHPEVSWVFSDMYLTDAHLKVMEIIEGGEDNDLLYSLLSRRGDVIHAPSNIVVRTADLLRTQVVFDPLLSTSADWDFCIQLAANKLVGRRIPEALWLYRILENSMSRNFASLEHDNLYVHKKASKQKLFESFSFKQQCFSNNYLILAGIWWVNGNKKLKGLWYIIRSMFLYPPNILKIIKKIRGSELYQAKRTVIVNIEDEKKHITVRSNAVLEREKKVAVFLMHRVNTITDPLWNPIRPSHFERIIIYLKRHYEVVPLERYMMGEYTPITDKPLCAVGFDDGYKDFLTFAAPILKKYNCPSSMYIVADCINNNLPPWTYILNHYFINTSKLKLGIDTSSFPVNLRNTSWNNKQEQLAYAKQLNPYLKSIDNSNREQIYKEILDDFNDVTLPYGLMLSWEEVNKLKDFGCEVGSHTYNHPMLSRNLSRDRIISELKDSAMEIERHTGAFPVSISYPFGAYNEEVKLVAQEVGYKMGVAVNPVKFESSKFDLYEIPRIELYDESMLLSIARLSQFLPKIKRLLQHNS